MTDELLAYLLDDLPADRRAEVDRRLAEDPVWRRELERLQDCLAAPDEPAACLEEPPQDLVHRTCFLVQRLDEAPIDTEARRPAPAATFVAGLPSRWNFSDLAVGGGVLVCLSWLMFPALSQSRDAARELACTNNLRALGTALFDYQLGHPREGQLPEIQVGDPAGVYASELITRGGHSREELSQWLLCPGSQAADDVFEGRMRLYIPSTDELRTARGKKLAQLMAAMNGIYAIRVGYFDGDGNYRPLRYTGGPEAMLADEPSLRLPAMRSANHAGGGQFVIYQSLRVKKLPTCELAPTRDNFYLNDRNEHAAGQRPRDTVMLKSDFSLNGRIVPIDAPR